MKNTVILIFFALCSIACTHKVTLSGEEIKKTSTTALYHTVRNNSSAVIELDASLAANEILVIGDKTLVENLEIENSDGKLSFSNKKHFSFENQKASLTIKLNNPKIEKVFIAGAGSFNTKNSALTNDVEFHISGAGEIDAKVLNNSTLVVVSGAGDVVLKGSAKQLSANMSGAGSLDAKNLNNFTATVEIAGAGDATVNTTNQLSIKISGVGNLDYKKYSTLQVEEEISGIGSVNPY